MDKIKFNSKLVSNVVLDLQNKIKNNHISNATIINSTTIILQFSFYRKEKLMISLDKNAPYISLLENIESIPTIDSGFSNQLRHHIRDSYIFDINQINDDSIICFHLKRKTSEFELEEKYLYIELIPLKPNIIITRDDNSVVFATHYGNEQEKRSLVVNQQYEFPVKENHEINDELPSLENVKKYGLKIYDKAILKRKKEKFDKTFKFIKNKIKLLKRKIPVLESEIIDGNDGLSYQELGNACYYMDLVDLKEMFLSFDKKYDDDLTNIENANLCFKKYKKSKSKIEEANKQLEIAKEDLSYYNHLLQQCDMGNEDDVAQIQLMLFPDRKMKPQERRKIKNFEPYFVKVDGATILFGKNDIQNDHLTFKIAHYKDIFVHIHNYPGAHIIIKTDKLSDEQLLTACEIALLLSDKVDGDISYCEVKNVKKTEKLGLVKIKEHKIVHLKNIRNSTKQLLKTAIKRG